MLSGRRRQAGFSMLEAMIAAALLGIIVVATSSYLVSTARDVKAQSVRDTQRRVYESLRLTLDNPDAIIESYRFPGNDLLRYCFEDSAPDCPKDVTRMDRQKEFNLVAPDGLDPIAGPLVRYSPTGEVCGTTDANCFKSARFGARAYFWITCPLNGAGVPAATCPRPLAFNARVQIVPLKNAKGSSPTQPYPPDKEFNPKGKASDAFSMSLKMTDLQLRMDEGCQPNQVQKGYDKEGKPRCVCAAGQAPDKKGNCPPQACKKGATMVGYKSNGTIKCVSADSDERCWEISLQDDGDCGAGAWLVRVDYGKCQAVDPGKHGKSGTTKIIDCNNDKGRCCMDFL